MSGNYDFRRYVPPPDNPKVAAMRGRDARQHAQAARNNPYPRDLLIDPWAKLYSEPFSGMTTDGKIVRGLYARAPNGAPTEAMIKAAVTLIGQLTTEQRKALCHPVTAPEWRLWNNTEIYLHEYGLRMDETSPQVCEAILDVIRQSLSSRGYDKMRAVMKLNKFLGELVGNTKVFNEYSFNFTLFGEPAASEPWAGSSSDITSR